MLFRHFRGEPDDLELEAKIAAYLRRIQGAHGGWPLFHDGAFDMSASVKAYFALKMIGDPIDAPHMRRAREAILARGGAARSNVFTRALLALYGAGAVARGADHAGRDHAAAVVVPVPPRQGVLLGAHRDGAALRAAGAEAEGGERARHRTSPSSSSRRPTRCATWPKGAHQKAPWSQIFGAIDAVLKRVEPALPEASRDAAPSTRRAPSSTSG